MKKLLITMLTVTAFGSAFSQTPVVVAADTLKARKVFKLDGNGKVDGDFQVNNLSASGAGTFNGTTLFNAQANFAANARFQNNVIMTGLSTASTLDNMYGLFQNEQGSVRKVDIAKIAEKTYSFQCPNLGGLIMNPTWANGPGIIYVGCPENVKVGISTNAPLYTLDVRGTGFFSQGIRLGNATASAQITNPAMIEMELSSNINRPFIRLSSKVGSNAPQVVFRVEKTGELWCTSAKVRLTTDIPVPDYVFKADYKLMPLNDLKAFVTEYSHLPNIPSEAEIRTNGLNLEEMQLKLLEKVEELTLYMIEVNDQNQELAKKNALLIQELEMLKKEVYSK